MKKRNGFVSNSSSSSFIINLGPTDTIDDLEDWIDFNVSSNIYEDIKADDIYNTESIISHLKSSFSKISLFDIKFMAFFKEFDKKAYYGKDQNLKNDLNLYYKDSDAFIEKYRSEIEEYDITGDESDNIYIGEMDDHHPIEMLIHNNDIEFKCHTIVISNH
jgi:hypothetical protein